MKKIHYFFIGLALIGSFGRADLLERFKEESKASKGYPCPSQNCPSQEDVSSYQYIFVEGFLGDYRIIPVNSISRVLKNTFGLTDSFIISPESKNSILVNTDLLYQKILNLRAQSPHRKAILMAFSKGGVETLLMILRHPEFITSGTISEVVIINGALQGSPLADLWVERCVPKVSELLSSDGNVCRALRQWQGGVTSLRPEYIVPVINRALASLSSDTRDIISDHLSAIQGTWGDSKAERTSNLWPMHLYLNRFGPNDGVILTEGEKLPNGFGENLATFSYDHTALLSDSSRGAVARRNEAFARAFIRELVWRDQHNHP